MTTFNSFITDQYAWHSKTSRVVYSPKCNVPTKPFLVDNLKLARNSFCILLVEDDADMRDYLASLLDADYRLYFASNGNDALNQLSRNPVDLIVSNISMPIMDGFGLLRALRQDKGDCTPFLFLTAHTEKSEVNQAFMLGANGYITKPFESDMLVAMVSNLLSKYQ